MTVDSTPGCDLAPISLVPRQAETVWGGRRLHELLGKPASAEPVGESWEVWSGDVIATGSWSGRTLEALTATCPDEVLGSVPLRRHSTRFPLLTKFIDAREPLSVQVHPNDAQARELEQQENGKTEAWYIIDAEPDAWVIHGLERAVDRGTLESRLRDGTADDLFHRVPVRAGDTIFVPAGTIHAIGPGILLHEAQQTSDVTYRLYDWNRKDHGHKRELHLDKGLQVSAFKPSHVSKVKPIQWTAAQQSLEVLIACSYFTIKKARLHGTYVVDTGRRSFHLVTSLDGRCSLRVNGVSDAIDLSRGHSAVVPASQGRYEIFPDNEATLLVEYVADLEEDLIPELQAAGIAPSTIEDFLRQFAAV